MPVTDPPDSNLRFSKHLAVIMVGAVVTLCLVISVTALWISRAHDRLAAASTQRMISGGVAALEEKLKTITIDNSLWTDAYEAILRHDGDWIWRNIGAGAAETGTTDLMIIEPGAAVEYGSVYRMERPPASGLLPAATIRSMLSLLDNPGADIREAVTRYVRIEGEIWLLAAMRVMPFEGARTD